MGSLITLPAPVRPGQPITADAFNKLIEAVKSSTLVSGNGIRVSRTISGTVVSVSQKTVAQGAAPSAIEHPFQIYDTSTGEDLQCKVRYGQVNNSAPSNYASNHTLTDDATNYVYLNCTLDVEGLVTAVAIGVSDTGTPSNTDTAAYKLLGRVVCADGVITSILQGVTHSLEFRTCDRTNDGGDPPAVVDAGSYHFWGV